MRLLQVRYFLPMVLVYFLQAVEKEIEPEQGASHSSASCNRKYLSAMKHETCVALLEKRFSLDKEQIVGFLDNILAGLVEELVVNGEVTLQGLGCFTVAHFPSGSNGGSKVVKFVPPRKSIVFFARPVSTAATWKIIGRKTGLVKKDAEMFCSILASHLRKRFKKKQEIQLEGLGVFKSFEETKYGFVADRELQDIVNTPYHHLSAVELKS